MATEESLKSIKEMMTQLIGDRCKRDAAEHARREAEIVAEHEKGEKEREAREREVQLQMERLQAYTERLTEIVETRKKLTADQSEESISGRLGSSNTTGDASVVTAAGRRPQPKKTGLERIQCFGREQFGHMERDRPEEESGRNAMSCQEEQRERGAPGEARGIRRCGVAEGQEMHNILLEDALSLWCMGTWFLRESSWRGAQISVHMVV